jgi:hypothetical protein
MSTFVASTRNASMFEGRGEGRNGRSSRVGNQTLQQRHENWQQHEVLAFIKCKHCEHVAQKEMVDPRTHMGPTM